MVLDQHAWTAMFICFLQKHLQQSSILRKKQCQLKKPKFSRNPNTCGLNLVNSGETRCEGVRYLLCRFLLYDLPELLHMFEYFINLG